MIDPGDLETRFVYHHPPDEEIARRHESVMFWANAGIARHSGGDK